MNGINPPEVLLVRITTTHKIIGCYLNLSLGSKNIEGLGNFVLDEAIEILV